METELFPHMSGTPQDPCLELFAETVITDKIRANMKKHHDAGTGYAYAYGLVAAAASYEAVREYVEAYDNILFARVRAEREKINA